MASRILLCQKSKTAVGSLCDSKRIKASLALRGMDLFLAQPVVPYQSHRASLNSQSMACHPYLLMPHHTRIHYATLYVS